MEHTVETKVITFQNKTYRTVPQLHPSSCYGCALYSPQRGCSASGNREVIEVCGASRIFQAEFKDDSFAVLKTKVSTQHTTPSISMSFDLDLSGCTLPEVFKVKSLRLSHLDDALAKGSDAFTLSAKDATQEIIEVIAEALKQEFLLRFSKEQK